VPPLTSSRQLTSRQIRPVVPQSHRCGHAPSARLRHELLLVPRHAAGAGHGIALLQLSRDPHHQRRRGQRLLVDGHWLPQCVSLQGICCRFIATHSLLLRIGQVQATQGCGARWPGRHVAGRPRSRHCGAEPGPESRRRLVLWLNGRMVLHLGRVPELSSASSALMSLHTDWDDSSGSTTCTYFSRSSSTSCSTPSSPSGSTATPKSPTTPWAVAPRRR
jgi:hypothetical protein